METIGKKFSVEDFVDALKVLLDKVESSQIKAGVLDRGMRGDRRGYDFTGKSTFFREHYPELQKLFYQVRGKGVLEGYVDE